MGVELRIHPEFALAYQRYAEFRTGDSLRLYVRTSGPGTGGLFYGIEKDEPEEEDTVLVVEGLRFFVKPQDAWYFDGGELSYDKRLGEYGFTFRNPRIDD